VKLLYAQVVKNQSLSMNQGKNVPHSPALNLLIPIYTPRRAGGRDSVRVKCLAQEHNKVTSAWAQTWTAQSRVRQVNHEATAPPIGYPLTQTLQLLWYITITNLLIFLQCLLQSQPPLLCQ